MNGQPQTHCDGWVALPRWRNGGRKDNGASRPITPGRYDNASDLTLKKPNILTFNLCSVLKNTSRLRKLRSPLTGSREYVEYMDVTAPLMTASLIRKREWFTGTSGSGCFHAKKSSGIRLLGGKIQLERGQHPEEYKRTAPGILRFWRDHFVHISGWNEYVCVWTILTFSWINLNLAIRALSCLFVLPSSDRAFGNLGLLREVPCHVPSYFVFRDSNHIRVQARFRAVETERSLSGHCASRKPFNLIVTATL